MSPHYRWLVLVLWKLGVATHGEFEHEEVYWSEMDRLEYDYDPNGRVDD